MLILALLIGGCGGSSAQNTTTGSQLDEDTGNAATVASGEGVGTAGTATNGSSQVVTGYSTDQCIADMTARYGSSVTAQNVCDAIRVNYGTGSQVSQLPSIVPTVENQLGAQAVPGAPSIPGSTGSTGGSGGTGGGSGGSGGGSGGSGGGSGSGWGNGIDIQVPGPPGQSGPPAQ